jgi:hypothetical protein
MVCGLLEAHLGRPKVEVGFGKFGKVALAVWTWLLGNGDLTIGQFAPHNLTKWTWQNTKAQIGKIGKQKNSHVAFTIWQREQKQAPKRTWQNA